MAIQQLAPMLWRTFVVFVALFSCLATAKLNATETTAEIILTNDRLFAAVNKATGAIEKLSLDGQNLLGVKSGSTGIGPYLDCYCTPSGFYTPGRIAPYYKLFTGKDSKGTEYGGILMGEVYSPTGQRLEQYWFLRDGETGLHTFSRLAYFNESAPTLRNLQEMRTLLRPNTPLWTHLSTNDEFYGPLPNLTNQITVQDATWNVNKPDDPYVQQISDFFTKYTFSTNWRDQKVHGMFADGSRSPDGSTFGAWMVMNTIDTYYGGPLHSDLVVDGIVYNYISSNHHGDQTPMITHGYDRTFGPSYHHFNKGPPGTTLATLRADAAQYASPTWNTQFYDSIATHVPGYVPSSARGTWKGQIALPKRATRPIAILTANRIPFQDNVLAPSAYQYWAPISPRGDVSIPLVKAGTYRLTVYADGIFGQHELDDILVTPLRTTTTRTAWTEESAGRELFRIGVPDKSSGEYRHGTAPYPNRTLHPPEHRLYWAVHDFPSDFPEGVRYTVGTSDPARDLNYVHWSVFGGKANSIRPVRRTENVANWTIAFDLGRGDSIRIAKTATFTVQLAGAKTAAGNTDIFNASEPWANLPLTVAVNGRDLAPWVIPYNQSSSCAVRSAVSCYNIAHKYVFGAELLRKGGNEFVLSLPANATNYEPALLPERVYVQYDALRLEVK